jgi:hypothetical protein
VDHGRIAEMTGQALGEQALAGASRTIDCHESNRTAPRRGAVDRLGKVREPRDDLLFLRSRGPGRHPLTYDLDYGSRG